MQADSSTAHNMVPQQNINKPNETPILFINFRDKEFTFYWDKAPYTLAPKETRWLPFWLAQHAAKILVTDEMNDRNLPADHHSRDSFMAKCIGNKPGETKKEDPLGIDILNKNMNAKIKEETPKKAGRPKKAVTEEDSFEGK